MTDRCECGAVCRPVDVKLNGTDLEAFYRHACGATWTCHWHLEAV